MPMQRVELENEINSERFCDGSLSRKWRFPGYYVVFGDEVHLPVTVAETSDSRSGKFEQ